MTRFNNYYQCSGCGHSWHQTGSLNEPIPCPNEACRVMEYVTPHTSEAITSTEAKKARKECGRCEGMGRIEKWAHINNGKCYSCNGKGYVDSYAPPPLPPSDSQECDEVHHLILGKDTDKPTTATFWIWNDHTGKKYSGTGHWVTFVHPDKMEKDAYAIDASDMNIDVSIVWKHFRTLIDEVNYERIDVDDIGNFIVLDD